MRNINISFSCSYFGLGNLHSFPTRRSSDLVPFSETRILGVLQRIAICYFIGATMIYFLTNRQLIIASAIRSEEHTSELQSRENLVCRLLLEKTWLFINGRLSLNELFLVN